MKCSYRLNTEREVSSSKPLRLRRVPLPWDKENIVMNQREFAE